MFTSSRIDGKTYVRTPLMTQLIPAELSVNKELGIISIEIGGSALAAILIRKLEDGSIGWLIFDVKEG